MTTEPLKIYGLKHQKQMLASSADILCIILMTSEMTLNGSLKKRPLRHAIMDDGCQDATKWNTAPIQLRHYILCDGEQGDLLKEGLWKAQLPTSHAEMAFVISHVLGHSPMVADAGVTQYRTARARDTWHVRRDIDIGDIWQYDMLPSLCHSKRLFDRDNTNVFRLIKMINVELDFLCHKGINKIVLSSVWHHTRQRVEEAISGGPLSSCHTSAQSTRAL